MIFVDAREGVSGDMLLAGMIGLLEDDVKLSVVGGIQRACERRNLTLHLLETEDEGERGLGLLYEEKVRARRNVSSNEAVSALKGIEKDLGSGGSVARRMLDLLLEAEAKAHNVPLDQVHLHELGRTQALVNLASIARIGSLLLSVPEERLVYSTITTGKGIVTMSHGDASVPAPVSRNLLHGIRHVPGPHAGERATPTGIAALRVLGSSQSDESPRPWSARSVGFGSKRFGGRLGRTVLVRA